MQLSSSRLNNLPPYPFANFTKRIHELQQLGHDLIRLDIGNPDMPPPSQVVEALCISAQNPAHHGYGPYGGMPELREAFADYYHRRFRVELDPDLEVMPLIGSKEGVAHFSIGMLDPGNVVLVPDPGYPAYAANAVMASAQPYYVRLDPDTGYLPDLASIPDDVLKSARLMWINYPNNPTGAVASVDDLAQIVSFCRENHIALAADNPYAEITYDGLRAPSILQVDGAREVAVEFNSLSKTYHMAGWRIGACVGNRHLIDLLKQVKGNVDSGLFRPLQDAAIVALNQVGEEWIAERNAIYRRRCDALLAGLSEIGLSARSPMGAMYVWAEVEGGDDVAYAHSALESAHVAFAPGSFFGASGRGYVRLSLVADLNRIKEAVERLREWYRVGVG
jgi:LL-diaminopimelate aminotransferase